MIQRIISAVVAAAVILPIIILDGMPFYILSYLMALVALFELLRMKHIRLVSFPGCLSLATIWMLLVPNFEQHFHFAMLDVILMSLLLLLTYMVVTKNSFTFEDAGFCVLTILYIGFGFLYFIDIRETNGLSYIFLAMFVIWSTDSGAYFAGRALGKRKLWPEISPKKTIEGAIGGVVCALVVALLFKQFVSIDVSAAEVVIISFLMAIFGQIGDLVESALKRFYGVKDSGNILPGHGGILDRLDSLIFVLPILHLLLKIFS